MIRRAVFSLRDLVGLKWFVESQECCCSSQGEHEKQGYKFRDDASFEHNQSCAKDKPNDRLGNGSGAIAEVWVFVDHSDASDEDYDEGKTMKNDINSHGGGFAVIGCHESAKGSKESHYADVVNDLVNSGFHVFKVRT